MNAPFVRLRSVLAAGLMLGSTLAAQTPKVEFPRLSPPGVVNQRVGVTDIQVTYSRPGVKGRVIFGGASALVPYGEVWRTGANEATKVSFSTPVKFAGADVPAGSYALFTIPGRETWTVILNRVTGQWGAYQYDAKNDQVRVQVPAAHLDQPVETFTIDINDIRDTSAALNLSWDQTRVSVPLQFDVVAILVPKIEAAMAAEKKPSAGFYDAAALFYLDNNLDLKQAAAWMEQAVTLQPNAFYLKYHQARVLAKLGDKAGALAAAHRSIELASAETGPAKEEYLRLNNALIASLGE